MKILAIEFPEGVTVSIPKGATVQISDGSNNMTGGKLTYIVDGLDETPVVPAHTHPFEGVTAGETGNPN